jgi:predicted RNA-binding Zn ribbon-like protein
MSGLTAIQHSDWKNGFLFVGNHLALDFLNTRPLQNGEWLELLPDFSAVLRWFQAAGVLSSAEATRLGREWGASPRARQLVEAMRKVREMLRKELLAWEGGVARRHTAIRELNRLLAEYPMRTRIKVSGNQYATESWSASNLPEDLFAPLADSAAKLFANTERHRVRKCGNCVLHFYDTSKKGTRHWCSMQLCGNRLKVAAYAARRRKRATM